jgi:predicted nucleic acid-binding protein
MKTATVTIRLDPKLQRELDQLSRQLGRSRSELVRDAVRRQIALLTDRFHASPHQLNIVESQLENHTIVPRPIAPSTLAIRDPDDAWVLASALVGGAQLLVTGDQDLLAVASQATIPILTPRAAWERLRGPE